MKEIKVNFPAHFKKMFYKLGLSDDDLENQILEFENRRERKDQLLGDLIPGTGGAIKFRFTSKDSKSGKSGAERIIYCAFNLKENLREYNFLLCYAKNQKETLTNKEKQALKNTIKNIKDIRQKEYKL